MLKRQKSTEQSYLDQLKFDPRLLLSPIAKYISNIRIVILLILTICLGGIFAYLSLPKRLNPEVKIPIVSVVTVLPGASPEDVESLLTIPLENELKGAEGLDTITSVSNQNASAITLQFASSVDGDKAKDDVQAIVDGVNDLPEDAQDPRVMLFDFEDSPIWTFVLTSPGDEGSLMSFSQELKKRIESVNKVDRVELAGFETQEVVVSLKPEKVKEFGINPLLLSQAVKSGTSSFPAGEVATAKNTFAVTINPSITTIEDLRKIQVSVQGQTLALGDVAVITEKSKVNQALSFLAVPGQQPRRSVTFYVYKTSSSSIDKAGADVEKEVESVLEEYDHRFELVTISNTSHEIVEQFVDLLHEFQTTIILVFVCLLIFLGLRQAIIASFTVPLTFLSAFMLMQVFGMSINFLSLFAFLLALGLLVDDTIVVVSAMTTYHKTRKFTPLQTGLLVWKDTIVPIWSTTITTIWAFAPLLLTSGIIGEFIKPLPIVVTITMISSTAIAVLITLPIMIVILKPQVADRVKFMFKALLVLAAIAALVAIAMGNPLFPIIAIFYVLLLVGLYVSLPTWKKRITTWLNLKKVKPIAQKIQGVTDHGLIDIHHLAQMYHRLILRILNSDSTRRKVMVAIVVYAIVCFALLPLGLVKGEFFPSTDAETISVNLELPAGTTLQETKVEANALLETLQDTPEADDVVSEVGRTNQHTAAFTIHLPPKEKRKLSSIEISQQLREQFKQYTKGTLSVVELSGGPPVGSDVEIKLVGDDLSQLDQYADKLIDHLKQQPGLSNVKKSITPGTTQIVFVPDLSKMSSSGVTVDQLGLSLRLFASGFTLDSLDLKNGQDETDVVFRSQDGSADPASLFALNVANQMGGSYPLNSLGHIETRSNPTQITREDGQRTISVSASTLTGYSTAEQNTELQKYTDSLNLPAGYSWKTGGANEENQESITSILRAMVISAILILVTMVIQFQSFRQALIVLVVIPLAVSSVFLLFAITGTPLSFPALIGVLSLFGIVVTNSMFIVDKINLNKRQGMKLKEAIADAGASRLEPIILTKLCTVLGLLPITIADPLWRGLGGAIISGVLLSSTIMLLFIPALYYTTFKGEEK